MKPIAYNYDIVIIGAGMIGLSIAFRLKRTDPDLKIAVVGDSRDPLMASRAAAGMLSPFCECEQDDRFFFFCRESLHKYPKFIQEVESVSGRDIHFSMAGAIMPHCSVGDQWEDRLRFFKEAEVTHEVWSANQMHRKLPYVSSDCGDVVWVKEGVVNNRQLHDALITAASLLGVEIIDHEVTGFLRTNGSLNDALTDIGLIRGGKFVLAGGGWCKHLGLDMGISIPIKPIKGQMCRLQVEENRLGYTVHGFLTYIVPWGNGYGFVVGSTMEDCGFDSEVYDSTIQKLIDNASAILPCLHDAPLVEKWTGFRPTTDDEMPIMGASVRYENLYYSTGHHRNGILQTPNQADYMTEIIRGRLKNEISEFSPTRYAL